MTDVQAPHDRGRPAVPCEKQQSLLQRDSAEPTKRAGLEQTPQRRQPCPAAGEDDPGGPHHHEEQESRTHIHDRPQSSTRCGAPWSAEPCGGRRRRGCSPRVSPSLVDHDARFSAVRSSRTTRRRGQRHAMNPPGNRGRRRGTRTGHGRHVTKFHHLFRRAQRGMRQSQAAQHHNFAHTMHTSPLSQASHHRES